MPWPCLDETHVTCPFIFRIPNASRKYGSMALETSSAHGKELEEPLGQSVQIVVPGPEVEHPATEDKDKSEDKGEDEEEDRRTLLGSQESDDDSEAEEALQEGLMRVRECCTRCLPSPAQTQTWKNPAS